MIGTQWRRSSRLAVLAAAAFLVTSFGLSPIVSAQEPGAASLTMPVRPTGPPNFLAAPSISLGYAPAAIAGADLTRNGRADVVTADSASGDVVVYLSDGHGGFSAPIRYPAGPHPDAIVVADLDGDGRLDVLVASGTAGTLTVLPGNGNGTLGSPRSYTLGFNAGYLAVGDFTGNGRVDVAAAGIATRALAVLQNDGEGNLGKPVVFATAQRPTGLAVGDFDHDGHADLAVAQADGSVAFFLGEGNGQFRASAAMRAVAGPISSIAAADLNHDGNIDLVATGATANTVSVLLGKGDGTFAAPASYAVGNSPAKISVADIDDDGIPDLVAVNRGSNTFSVLKGAGNGTFEPAQNFVAGNGPADVATGDFYGSGHTGLAVMNFSSQSMSVPVGNGDGTFQAARSYTVGAQPVAMASADLNGDGFPDLVVAKTCAADASCGAGGNAVVLLGEAGGTYRISSSFALGAGPVSIALVDVNGDRHPDLVAVDRVDKTLIVRLGLGDGNFGQAITTSLAGAPVAVAAAAFHARGTMDLAVLEDCGSSGCAQPGNVEILAGAADGNFQSAGLYQTGYAPVGFAIGPLHASGKQDIVVANRCGASADCSAGGTATVLIGNGTGNFKPGKGFSLGNGPAAIALGALTGSGVLDAVVSRSAGNAVSIYRGNGDGTFQSGVAYPAGHAPGALAIADFTGDGKSDVAVVNGGDSTISLFAGNGDGTLQSANTVTVGTGPVALAMIGASGSHPGLATANGNPGAGNAGKEVTVLANLLPPGPLPTPTVTLTVTPASPTNVDAAVTLSVQVAASPAGANPGTPTGIITFAYNDQAITTGSMSGVQQITDCEDPQTLQPETNPVPLNANGSAACLTHQLPGSGSTTDQLTGDYSGDTANTNNYAPTASNTVNQTVKALVTTLNLTPTPGSSEPVGTAVTFTAQLAGTFSPGVVPTGTVSFLINSSASTDCQPVAVSSTGSATCTTSALVVPSDKIQASYAGDPSYTVNGTTTFFETITQGSAFVTVSSPTNPSFVNQQITVTAQVAANSAGTATTVFPKGNVSFTPTTGASCSSSVGLSGDPGTASCNYTFTSASSGINIQAAYGGDSDFGSSTGSLTSPQVVKATSTTVGLTATPSSPPVNTQVSFQATVTPQFSGAAVPTGSVTITDQSTNPVTQICKQNLSSGTVPACPFTFTTSGTHNIQAAYTSGDANFAAPAQPTTLPVNVGSGTTSVTLTSSPNPSLVNQQVTLTAAINTGGSVANLNGTIAYTDTTTSATLCSKSVTAGVVPTCTTAFGTAVTHMIVAAFTSSNTNQFSSSTSSPFSQTVNQAQTQTTVVSASPSPSQVNQSVTYTVTVTTNPSTPATPTGTVAVSAALGSQVTAECTITLPATTCSAPLTQATTTTTGPYTITAVYSGDTNFLTSTSQGITHKVGTPQISISITPPASAPVVNGPVTFSTTITPSIIGATAPSGSVIFSDSIANTQVCSPAVLVAGASGSSTAGTSSASCTVTFLAAGSHTITVTYAGDTNFPGGSQMSPVTVQKAATTLALTPGQVTAVAAGSPVTFSVVVTPMPSPQASGGALPTGSITFSSASAYAEATLQSCGASGVVNVTDDPKGTAVANCTVTFPHVTTPPGTFSVTAAYSGDGNFAANTNTTGNASSVTVQDAGISLTLTPTGKIGTDASTPATSSSPALDFVTQGFTNSTDPFNSATIAATVVTAGSFTDTLNFTCSVVNPATNAAVTDPSCAITPVTSESGSGGVYQKLTITLTASANAATGAYSVSVQAKDQTTVTFPALTSQPISVYVLPVSGTLDLAAGASGTANPVFNTATAPAGASLVSFSCPTILSVKGTAATFAASCSGATTPVTGAATSVAITISFPSATAALAHPSMTMYAAAFATPFFAVIAWLGSRKSSRRNFFRFLGMVLVMVGVASLNGCGGSYSGPGVTHNKTITPGAYYVEVIAKDANGNSYYTVVAMVITA